MNSTPTHEDVKADRTFFRSDDPEAYLLAMAPLLARVRRDVRAVKLRQDTSTQKAGDTKCERKPLSDAAMIEHFSGRERYGAYLMEKGSTTTRVALLDLDSHKGETPWPEMQRVALALVEHLERAGCRPIPFRSAGGAGIHLLMLWDEPQDAYSVRYALRTALAACGMVDGTGGVARGEIEAFPKQDVCADVGHMFYLPLGGKSAPLDPFELDDMPREYVLEMEWPLSAPVPVAQRPVAEPRTGSEVPVELARVKAMLDAIPNSGDDELPYEGGLQGRDYLSLIIALHRATGGSDSGLALAHELASRSSKYCAADVEKRWSSVTDRADGITARTLEACARHYGFAAPSEDDFEVLSGDSVSRPAYQRDNNGRVLALVGNVVKALRSPLECGARIARDEFRAQNMLDGRVATDEDITELQMRLEARDFLKLSKELVRDAFYKVAFENAYDSAIEWIGTLQWDGVPRVERFLAEHFGADDTPYTRAVSRYMWTALAGRALVPAIQADMVPTLVGPQGIGKTQGVKAIAPAPELFCELGFAERDVEASRKMRGRLVIELGELRGMSARDIEGVKAFITRQSELFRDLYRNNMVEFPRRHLFIGTTNKDQFLSDDTGERRWLPVRVTKCDPAAIERDRDQLWAEAVVAFQQQGIAWQDAQRLASAEHDEFKLQDEWEPTVLAWMHEDDGFGSGVPAAREFLRTDEVLIGALRFEAKTIRPGDSMRIAAILKRQGYARAKIRVQGHKTWVYLRDQGDDMA